MDFGIPVVWGIDGNYVLQAFVVMRSILLHSGENYHFIILTSDCIENQVKEYTDILRKNYENFEVSVKKVDIERFEGARIVNAHLSKASYFRLLIPEVLAEYDKCIYLDCDLIVHGDVRELYSIDLEGCYLAGVKDCHVIADTLDEIEHQKILGIPSRDRYINAGVLVMNLRRLRADHLVPAFMEQMKKENRFEDQDVLNLCCYPAIKILPLKYNLFHFYTGKSIRLLYGLPYERSEFEFDEYHPFIMHMGGRYKPWSNFDVKGSREWWQTAEIFRGSVDYRRYRRRCRDAETHRPVREMIARAQDSKSTVVWGCGKNGRRVCDLLLEWQVSNLTAIVDNNKSQWKEQYRGIQVAGPDTLMEESDRIFWIISSRRFYREIAMQLKAFGIKEENTFLYSNDYEEIMYLLSLSEEAYDNEIDRIADMEYVRSIPDKNDRLKRIKEIIRCPDFYEQEYAYLKEKYNFRYWIGMGRENL